MKLQYRFSVSKQLKGIGAKDLKKVQTKIHFLIDNPLEGKPLQGELKGYRSLRAWPLRIIYTFDSDSQIITIETVDYRGDVYK